MTRNIGPYRIVRLVGEGGMAQVFLAHRFGASGFVKEVALKALRPECADDPELQRLLIAEAKLSASMSHRNLVGVFDLGSADGSYYVAMEYVDGGDLGQLCGGERVPEPLALLVIEEIAYALEYAHRLRDAEGRPLGLVHRDVSPSNVLLSRSGEVKLADFGIAKATNLAEQTRARIVRGKYAYLSPEQISGDTVTDRCDQFSLGVTAVQLLTGHRPFDGATAVETMERIADGMPPNFAGVPDDAREALSRCLAREPSERFDDMTAMRRAIAELRRGRESVGPTEVAQWVVERSASASALPGATRTATIPGR